MKIFLSWSGERSKYIANVINEWLPRIIQHIEIWYSTKHIPKGKAWFEYIRDALEKTNVGIICLTPENIHSEWILFESGAI